MKDTLNIVVMDEDELNNLKKRIHNQRSVINNQKDDIKLLEKDNKSLNVDIQAATDDNADYEDTIKHLAVKHNKLAKENDELRKSEAQHKGQLIAVKHALNSGIQVSLR